jgi:hypothetical protein
MCLAMAVTAEISQLDIHAWEMIMTTPIAGIIKTVMIDAIRPISAISDQVGFAKNYSRYCIYIFSVIEYWLIEQDEIEKKRRDEKDE